MKRSKVKHPSEIATRLKELGENIRRTEDEGMELARSLHEQGIETDEQLEHIEQVTAKVLSAVEHAAESADRALRESRPPDPCST